MTALRAVAVAVLEALVVLAAVSAVFWAAVGPQDFRTVAWLAVMFVTVAGSGVALEWLGRRRRGSAAAHAPGPCNCPCGCPNGGRRDDDGTPGLCDPCRMRIHQEA